MKKMLRLPSNLKLKNARAKKLPKLNHLIAWNSSLNLSKESMKISGLSLLRLISLSKAQERLICLI